MATLRSLNAIVVDHGFVNFLVEVRFFIQLLLSSIFIQLLLWSNRILWALWRSCLWNAPLFSLFLSVRVHNSQLYKKKLDKNALQIQILVLFASMFVSKYGFQFGQCGFSELFTFFFYFFSCTYIFTLFKLSSLSYM